MTRINLLALLTICPQATGLYRSAFALADTTLQPFGILDTPQRSAHFLAQVLHESGGLRVCVENLNYSAKRLTEVWPSRFKTIEQAQPYARNPRELANKVYGGRMGNVNPDDGWRYVGRGLLQLTGRSNYARIGTRLSIDLLGNPDLAMLPEFALPVAGAAWDLAHCNVSADRDDLEAVTRRINGGLIGLKDRREWLDKARGVVEAVTSERRT